MYAILLDNADSRVKLKKQVTLSNFWDIRNAKLEISEKTYHEKLAILFLCNQNFQENPEEKRQHFGTIWKSFMAFKKFKVSGCDKGLQYTNFHF